MYKADHAKEKQREATRRYRERHAEELKAKAESVKGTEEQRAIWREKTRKWRKANAGKNKEIERKAESKRYHGSKDIAFALLGNKCAMFHVENDPLATDVRSLQIDHIDAIGDAKRRELNQRGRHLYREVVAHPEKYQLLCACHNWIKRHENKEGNKGSIHATPQLHSDELGQEPKG